MFVWIYDVPHESPVSGSIPDVLIMAALTAANLVLGIYKPIIQRKLMTVLGWLYSAMILAVFVAFWKWPAWSWYIVPWLPTLGIWQALFRVSLFRRQRWLRLCIAESSIRHETRSYPPKSLSDKQLPDRLRRLSRRLSPTRGPQSVQNLHARRCRISMQAQQKDWREHGWKQGLLLRRYSTYLPCWQ